jgi:hypothetical protein
VSGEQSEKQDFNAEIAEEEAQRALRRVSAGERGFEASSRELEDRSNLFARNIELFDDFVNGQAIFEVLEDGCYGHACAAENPRATQFAGDAFDGGALGPI